MKHFLLVTTSFPDDAFALGQEAAGGFVFDFSQELAKHTQVTVVAPSQKNSVDRQGNLSIRRFAVPHLPLSLLKPQNPRHWPAIVKTVRGGQRAVRLAVNHTTVDHILALWALPSGYWAYRLHQEMGVPYSIWALGSDIWTLGKVPLVKNVLKTVLQKAAHQFADGHALAQDVRHISHKPCQFLPSSRHLRLAMAKKIAHHPPYKLAFLGRWHPNKGIDLLLDSLALLSEEDWQQISTIQICGGGPLEAAIKEKGAALQANGRPIQLRGYLNKDEASALLTWADYLLLPSRIESIPVIFSDALQSKCAVIATPVGDVPTLMKEHPIGFLATTVSAGAFALAIQAALAQAPATFQDGIATLAQKFSLPQTVQTLLESVWPCERIKSP